MGPTKCIVTIIFIFFPNPVRYASASLDHMCCFILLPGFITVLCLIAVSPSAQRSIENRNGYKSHLRLERIIFVSTGDNKSECGKLMGIAVTATKATIARPLLNM